jgi:predicted porin
MKKTLLTTTAIAVTGFAGAANAVDITNGDVTLSVGGFFNTTVAATSVDAAAGTDFDGVDVLTNSEIIFAPSMTLDNGITIGANVQLEGNTSGDQIDESYFIIRGDFGEVNIGSENSAGYKMTVAAPDVSHIYANSTSLTSFVPFSGATAGADIFRGTLGSTYIENARNNDAQRITYYTPRFGGLQLGVSYARDGGQGNGAVDNNTTLTDIVDIAANYGGSFGGVDLNASARYGTASAPGAGTDPEIWGAGLSIGFSGFTIGGSYAEQDDAGNQNGDSYDVGVSYATGDWSYSLTYFNGTNQDDTIGMAGVDEELEIIVAAARYTVNSNFSVSGFIADVDFQDPTPGQSVDGTVVGVSAGFSF